MGNIVTTKEIASLLKVTESTIYNLAWSGQLPGFKIGDWWKFEMEDILKLIQAKMKSPENRKEDRTNLED